MESDSYVEILTEWDIVAARQLGRNVAKELGFGRVDQARITSVISELARNIYLYAGQGEIIIEILNEQGKTGLKVTATDNGPGIQNIRRVMENGFSSSGGLGAGLPGVKRLVDHFDISSSMGEGTNIQVVKWLR
jgi:serine/threonine-protein kinase RsbT